MISLNESLLNIPHIFEASYTVFVDIDKADIEPFKSHNDIIDWLKGLGVEQVLIGSDNKYVKIPRSFKRQIQDTAPKHGVVIDGDDILYSNKKIAMIGDGSPNQVTTKDQETATAQLWNLWIMTGQETDAIIDGALKNDKDGSWRKSCLKQCTIISRFLDKHGITGEAQRNYRACVYDEENTVHGVTTVGKSYAKFVKHYAQLIREAHVNYNESNKHHFDPSDIVLYKLQNDVAKKLDDLCKEKDHAKIITAYRDMYKKKLLFGISLKKISGNGTFHEFNIEPDKRQIINITGIEYEGDQKQGVLKISGTFSFINTPDPEDPDDPIKDEKKIHTLYITCRDFKPVAMDIKEPNKPPLGKVQKATWVKQLHIDHKNDLSEVIKGLAKLDKHNNSDKPNKNTIEIVKTLIQSAIKDGPYCLPFTLIH